MSANEQMVKFFNPVNFQTHDLGLTNSITTEGEKLIHLVSGMYFVIFIMSEINTSRFDTCAFLIFVKSPIDSV